MNYKKIKHPSGLRRILKTLKQDGKRIVFTNGCFDILHLGHIGYLQKASSFGEILVVGLNSDSSIRKIKGPNRPIIDEHSRAGIIAALECVDYVTIFNEKIPLRLIKLVKPDVLVKGGDWKKDEIVGKDFVTAYGGKVKTIPYIRGYSTSRIIEKIGSVIRIIDANLNRSREGLRVCEDIARFYLNSQKTTETLKRLRHAITRSICLFPFKNRELFRDRDANSDIGKGIKLGNVNKKAVMDIFFANMERTKEALRVLEECSKLFNHSISEKYRIMRFKTYEIEKEIASKLLSICDTG